MGVKKMITKTLEQTFQEFQFPPEFATEIARIIKEEPKSGYTMVDLMAMINELSSLTKEPERDIIKSVYCIIAGQLLAVKHGVKVNEKTG